MSWTLLNPMVIRRLGAGWMIFVLCAGLFIVSAPVRAADFDLLIVNGTVYDGHGGAPIRRLRRDPPWE